MYLTDPNQEKLIKYLFYTRYFIFSKPTQKFAFAGITHVYDEKHQINQLLNQVEKSVVHNVLNKLSEAEDLEAAVLYILKLNLTFVLIRLLQLSQPAQD